MSRQGWSRQAFLVFVTVGLSGCTQFQALHTDRWWEMPWSETTGLPVNHVLAYFDQQIYVTQDIANQRVPLPGLAGRLMLYSDGSRDALDAEGDVVVQLFDITNVKPGAAPPLLVDWKFDPVSLKRLKKKDRYSDGYTLFLPWPGYQPDVRKVHVQLIYVPKKGEPLYADAAVLNLQAEPREAPLVEQQNYQVVPSADNRTPLIKRSVL